jgi:hypothetical protein
MPTAKPDGGSFLIVAMTVISMVDQPPGPGSHARVVLQGRFASTFRARCPMHSLPVSICNARARKHGDERKLLVGVAIEGPALKGDLLRE